MLRVKWKSLECMHLDSMFFKLSLQNTISLMGLFGYADAHGYFSLNDIQFWALMYNLTDMPTEIITSYFFKLDCDYTGELNFVEFQLLCACMIAAKDRVTKEFLQRHFRTLVSIQDTGKHNYLPLMDFVKVGALMGWNLGTMDRIYKYWDRSFELERYRIKNDYAKTFILFAIDHERATQARRRVTCIKQFKHRWLLGLEDLITNYYKFDALPSPPVLWERMTGTEPPFLKPMKETKEERGCCEYCFFGLCVLLILPWFLLFCTFWSLWKHAPWFRHSVIWIRNVVTCKPCHPACIRFFTEHPKPADPSKPRIPPDSSLFYNRNKHLIKKVPKFRYLQTQRELRGLFDRIDPWEDSWLRAQLRLEALEKQLLSNRIKSRKTDEIVLSDTFGVTALRWKKYVANARKSYMYKARRRSILSQPLPPKKSSLAVNTDDLMRSKYPARFLNNFTAHEILTAEHQLKEAEFNKSKGDNRVGRRRKLRETVGGFTRIKQKEANELRRLASRAQMEKEKAEEKAEEDHEHDEKKWHKRRSSHRYSTGP